jgi:hypothetical protein
MINMAGKKTKINGIMFDSKLEAISYGITAVPTIIKLDGENIESLIGYRPKKDLEAFLV